MRFHYPIRARCSICDAMSPTCDQSQDPHRNNINEWWFEHQQEHMPHMIFEPVPTDEYL